MRRGSAAPSSQVGGLTKVSNSFCMCAQLMARTPKQPSTCCHLRTQSWRASTLRQLTQSWCRTSSQGGRTRESRGPQLQQWGHDSRSTTRAVRTMQEVHQRTSFILYLTHMYMIVRLSQEVPIAASAVQHTKVLLDHCIFIMAGRFLQCPPPHLPGCFGTTCRSSRSATSVSPSKLAARQLCVQTRTPSISWYEVDCGDRDLLCAVCHRS